MLLSNTEFHAVAHLLHASPTDHKLTRDIVLLLLHYYCN